MSEPRHAGSACAAVATELIVEAGDWPPETALVALAQAAVGAVAVELGLTGGPSELSLVFTDDARMRVLNAGWRGKDKPTNVLSFGSPDDWNGAAPDQPCPLGDVILARETVLREARQQGKTPADHVTHLVIHGVLHLLGHDHTRSADARKMEAIETDILSRLGIADPYRLPARRRVKG
jgi:probable rRNA maturation factor